jgi:hypothetical protein
MAQTAVTWLVEKVNSDCLNSTYIDIKLVKEAKEMEKEQIDDAHESGIRRCYLEVDDFGARLVKPIEGIAGQDYYYFKYDTNGL